MTRIPYAEPGDGPDVAAALARHLPVNLMRLLAHSPPLIDTMVPLGMMILTAGKLDPCLRELAILRVGHLCASTYETFHHETIGQKVGLSEARRSAARVGSSSSGLSSDDLLVLSYAEEIFAGVVSDTLFARARARFSNRELVELTFAAAFYICMSKFLSAFDLDIDQDLASDSGRHGELAKLVTG